MTIKEEYESILSDMKGFKMCLSTKEYLDRRLSLFFSKHGMHDFKYELIEKYNSIEVRPVGNLSSYAMVGILSENNDNLSQKELLRKCYNAGSVSKGGYQSFDISFEDWYNNNNEH